MDKLKFRRSGIQARVLALTMFFTLGASLVIAASNMHQMTAEWERTTILNAEYALQTAASAIRRDVDEIDDLAGWCAYNPGMRTYLLTGDTASNQARSMYPTLTAKFNSMRTMAYIQRFLLINASGQMCIRDRVLSGKVLYGSHAAPAPMPTAGVSSMTTMPRRSHRS